MGLYRIRATFGIWGQCGTITYILIEKYLGGVRSALALTLIFGLEVWMCVLFAGLFAWAVVSEGVGCVRDSAMVSKGSRLDDADGNPVLLVRQRHGGVQLADRIERMARLAAA